jgi:transcriptional regulator with XRE-family HTH domain
MSDFGDELASWMTARQIGVRELARRSGYTASFISQLRHGTRRPSPDTAQDLDDALGAGGDLSTRVPPRSQADTGRLAEYSEDIQGLMAWIANSNTTDDAIEQIEHAAAYLAEAHSRIPPKAVLSGVLQAHRQAQDYLQNGRQRLRQTRELLRIDSDLAAHASLLLGDLGQYRKATEYGAAALLLAQEAGSSEATAWSVQAKTARWQERYVESAELARRGFETSQQSTATIELAYREANAIALFGDVSRAQQALRRAEKAADILPSDGGSTGSVWSFSIARQAIFALSVAIHTGDPDSALRAAAVANVEWENGEPKVPATWAQIQTGSSIAYLAKDSLDGAAQHVAPVLQLSPELRISTVTGYLQKLELELTQSRFAKSEIAIGLTRQIREFTSAAPQGKDAAEG